jgi:hypothetical protein
MSSPSHARWAAPIALLAALGPGTARGADARKGGSPPAANTVRATKRFEFESVRQIEQLFQRFGYTREAWQAGVRVVPRVFITDVPAR